MKNHFLSRGYLRGFLSSSGLLDERDHCGRILKAGVDRDEVGFEEMPPEPAIERLRRRVENKWGRLRDGLSNLRRPLNLREKSKLARFLSQTILLAKSGRRTVRSSLFGRAGDLAWAEEKVIEGAILILQNHFLTMKWLLVKPAFPLLCGEMPVALGQEFNRPAEDVKRITAVWFPLTAQYLLYLNPKIEGYYAYDVMDGDRLQNEAPFVLATRYGLEANRGLIECARANRTKIYAPAGYWPV